MQSDDLGRYLILDLECGTEAAFKRKSNPFVKDEAGQYKNGLYYFGYRRYDESENQAVYSTAPAGLPRRFPAGVLDNVDVIVGFNVCGYDLHYLWEDPQLIEFFKRGGRVHDCQYAEYLLRAQHQKAQMCSLNDVAPLYGGDTKVDAIAEMWKQGIKTYEIPVDLMLEYLIGHDKQGGDIGNTLKVYTGQVEKLHKLKMFKAWLFRMDGMLCTSRMQFNGIKVDLNKAEELLVELQDELDTITAKLSEFLPPDLPEQIEWTWSNRQKSAILFGGALHYQERGPILDDAGNCTYTKATEDRYLWQGRPVPPELMIAPGKFKSKNGMLYECDTFLSGKRKGEYKTKKVEVQGKLKTKLYDKLFHLPQIVQPDPDWATKTTDRAGNVVYSTGDEQMEALQHSGIPFCEYLSRYAALLKEIGTYYRRNKEDGEAVGMLTLVDPTDSILHHMLNHTLTVTTRLSSSNP